MGVLVVASVATIGIAYYGGPRNAGAILQLPERHRDGDGLLGSTGDPTAWQAFGFDPKVGGPGHTIGIHLCLTNGDAPAVLDGTVSPRQTVGAKIAYLGSYVRQFRPSDGDAPIGGLNGFPPYVREKLVPVKGFTVTYKCQPSDPDPAVPYTELLIGVAPIDGTLPGGGGWIGVDVGYSVGGRHHVVQLGDDVFICGPAVPHPYC